MHTVTAASRLVLIRLASPIDEEAIARFAEKTRYLLLTARSKVVTIADLRALAILSPDSADILTTMLVRNNPRVERTAILLPNLHGALGMQFARLLGTSKNAQRLVFEDPDCAARYLDDVLDPSERACLAHFLAGGEHPTPSMTHAARHDDVASGSVRSRPPPKG
jgi:hypothetical protein